MTKTQTAELMRRAASELRDAAALADHASLEETRSRWRAVADELTAAAPIPATKARQGSGDRYNLRDIAILGGDLSEY